MSEQWRPVEKRIDLPAITIANRGAYLEIPDIACTLPDGLRVCEPVVQEDTDAQDWQATAKLWQARAAGFEAKLQDCRARMYSGEHAIGQMLDACRAAYKALNEGDGSVSLSTLSTLREAVEVAERHTESWDTKEFATPAPRPIKSEADHEAALKRIEALMDAEPGTPEEEELQHWTILVHDYEENKYPVPYAGLSSEWNHAIIEGCKFPAIDFDGTGSRKETPYRCRMGQAVAYGATAEEAIKNAYAVWKEGRDG